MYACGPLIIQGLLRDIERPHYLRRRLRSLSIMKRLCEWYDRSLTF